MPKTTKCTLRSFGFCIYFTWMASYIGTVMLILWMKKTTTTKTNKMGLKDLSKVLR